MEHNPTDLSNTSLIVKYVRDIHKLPLDTEEASASMKYIETIIDNEISKYKKGLTINQPLLSLAIRAHSGISKKYNINNTYLKFGQLCDFSVDNHIKLQSFLLSNQFNVTADANNTIITNFAALAKAANDNEANLGLILKTVNLLLKKCPRMETTYLCLHHLYFCLQSSQSSVKDETILLLNQIYFNKETSLKMFKHIINFWPWTNKNKLYILYNIIKNHSIKEFLLLSDYSEEHFYNGIRLSLLYKNLIPAGQFLIRLMAERGCQTLFTLIANILMNGSTMEIQNLCLQWLPHILKKELLFEVLQKAVDIKQLMKLKPTQSESLNSLIVILSIFPKQLHSLYRTPYHHLKRELIEKCFQFDPDTQLLIFKFIVDNMADIPIGLNLKFIYEFLLQHKCVENARIRNSILAKLPVIINYTSNALKKAQITDPMITDSTALSVALFYQQLQLLVEKEIFNTLYQPKIFSLKILEVLLKSVYSNKLTKNAKNCDISDNEKLGEFLKRENGFDNKEITKKLLSLLNDTADYDDTHDLALQLLLIMPLAVPNSEVITLCKECCAHEKIDECNLSSTYATVVLENIKTSNDLILDFYNDIFHLLDSKLIGFKKDPLLACKIEGSHLFGYISVLGKIVQFKANLLASTFFKLLDTTENIVSIILNMLNITNVSTGSASFQDMEESLLILVHNSSYVQCNDEENRKFLLLSLWLTLKACCELVTSLCNFIIDNCNETNNYIDCLKRCLLVVESVLTRCRHKGAIEFAGICIGTLTKALTAKFPENASICQFVESRLHQLYDLDDKFISTTRRGAGFSIMFLHILKNESQCSRPFLRKTLKNLFHILKCSTFENQHKLNINCDRLESLVLHYLCVLVRDAELREFLDNYYNEMIMHTLIYTNSNDWTICNAALQLFGALLSKIIGQLHSTSHIYDELNLEISWQTCSITFGEIVRKFPSLCDYVLSLVNKNIANSQEIRSMIMLLEFFHKVPYIHKNDPVELEFLEKFRHLMWSLLYHPYAKIRKLASICFVNSHEFKYELPLILLQISEIVFNIKNENFFDSLLFIIHEGILKIMHESQFTANDTSEYFITELKSNIKLKWKLTKSHRPYTLCKLLDVLLLLNFEHPETIITDMAQLRTRQNDIGLDLFETFVEKLNKKTVFN